MKIRNTHSLFAVVALWATLSGGCTKELLRSEEPPTLKGEEVEVALSFAPEIIASPFALPAAAKASAAMSQPHAAQSGGGMIVEMVDEPAAPATRAGDDATVSNVWVFQFNGSGDNALLVVKKYLDNVTDDSKFALKVGTDQRIVVLANSFDPTLGSALTTSSTYAALKELVHPSDRALQDDAPMSGNLITDVSANTPLTIPLTRIFAKVTVRVKLGAGMTTTGWSAQAFDVAPAYWLPETNGDFPAANKLNGDSYTPQSNITFSTTDFTDLTFYLPINRRGEVAGTSNVDRRTKAPTGSTYIKLFNTSTVQNIYTSTNYYIHLGANQTSDYNLRGNTKYTLKATLFAAAGGDSRMETINSDITDLQYAGMFGGELKARGGVWQFTKELWVQKTDASTNTKWDTNTPTVVTNIRDKVDGKGNTLALVNLGERYAAAKVCFDKNTGLNAATTTIDTPAYQWYLPAQNQLMGVWAAHSSLSNAFASSTYWSSPEYDPTYSWFVDFSDGSTNGNGKLYNRSVRCVREL